MEAKNLGERNAYQKAAPGGPFLSRTFDGVPQKARDRVAKRLWREECFSGCGREVTYQSLLEGLKGTPAYRLLFGVGLLGSGVGLGAMIIGWFQSDRQLEMFGFVAWVFLLAAVVAVIFFMERRGVDPVSKFSRRLKGYWWETITPNAPYLSFLFARMIMRPAELNCLPIINFWFPWDLCGWRLPLI